jgi:hypothetical protein
MQGTRRERRRAKKKKQNTKHPPAVTFIKNKHIPRGTSTRPVILLLQVVFPKLGHQTPKKHAGRKQKKPKNPQLILRFKT